MKKLILLIFYLFLFQVNVGWGQTIQPADYLYFETDIYESPYDLLQTKDGSFIISGFKRENANVATFDWYFIKVNKNFEVVNEKTYKDPNNCTSGGGQANAVELEDGSIIVAFASTRTPNYYSYIIKLNSEIDTIWRKEVSFYSQQILLAHDGNVIIITPPLNNMYHAYKLSAESGEIIWHIEMPQITYYSCRYPAIITETGFSVCDYQGMYYYSDDGVLENTYTYELGEILHRHVLPNGDLIINSRTAKAEKTGHWLARCSPNGTIKYCKEYEYNNSSFFEIKKSNNFLLTCENLWSFFEGYVGYITRYDNYFNLLNDALVWIYPANMQAIDYETSNTDGHYMVIFKLLQENEENSDIVFARVEPFTEPINVNTIETMQVKVSPNPATDVVQISFPEIFSGTIEICNLQGQKVFDTQTENIQQTTINISNLSEGFYLLKTFNNQNNTTATTKFIVN